MQDVKYHKQTAYQRKLVSFGNGVKREEEAREKGFRPNTMAKVQRSIHVLEDSSLSETDSQNTDSSWESQKPYD